MEFKLLFGFLTKQSLQNQKGTYNMLTSTDKFFIALTVLCVCVAIAILMCYVLYLHVEEKRTEKTRKYLIQLTKLNAEEKSPYMKKMMTDEIIREIQKIRLEINSVFDKLENMRIE